MLAGHQRTVPSGDVWIDATASTSDGGLTNAAVHGMLDRMFRNQAFTVAGNFLALFTTAPTDSAGGTEVSTTDTGYARVEINEAGGASPAWESESGGAVANDDDVLFAAPPEDDWGNVKASGILTAITGGTLLWWLNLPDQDVGPETTQIGYLAGALELAVTGS